MSWQRLGRTWPRRLVLRPLQSAQIQALPVYRQQALILERIPTKQLPIRRKSARQNNDLEPYPA